MFNEQPLTEFQALISSNKYSNDFFHTYITTCNLFIQRIKHNVYLCALNECLVLVFGKRFMSWMDDCICMCTALQKCICVILSMYILIAWFNELFTINWLMSCNEEIFVAGSEHYMYIHMMFIVYTIIMISKWTLIFIIINWVRVSFFWKGELTHRFFICILLFELNNDIG